VHPATEPFPNYGIYFISTILNIFRTTGLYIKAEPPPPLGGLGYHFGVAMLTQDVLEKLLVVWLTKKKSNFMEPEILQPCILESVVLALL
jgi:hypothetical protein